MCEQPLQDRVEKCARWYLTNVCELNVLEDLTGDDGALQGFVTRDTEDVYRFIYLSYQTVEELERWASGISFGEVRQQFESDIVQFFSQDDPRQGRICLGELRTLVLADDRAIFKLVLADGCEVCA